MSLKEYRSKRKFGKTPEPRGKTVRAKGPLRFVIQKHDATREHYDLRLEIGGVYRSWAVPKGPSLSPHDTRLAVRVEDHPIDYGDFEGVIPKGNYGAGTVMIWDAGTFVERGSKGRADSEKALKKGLAEGHITFVVTGEKLRGEFALVKVKKKGADAKVWLLVKKRDEHAAKIDVTRDDRSTHSNRSMKQIADEAVKKGELWLPGKGRAKEAPPPRAHSTIPHRVRPMEAAIVAKAPAEKGWIYESALGGVRAIAEVERSRVHLYSKSFLPFERKYPAIVTALRALDLTAVLDGEIVKGEYVLTDVLYYEGSDLREKPLSARKKVLAKIKGFRKIEWSESPPAAGPVVAKRAASPYAKGVSRDWAKFYARVGKEKPAVEDKPPITHASKIFFPDDGYTKGDLVRYYESVADVIMPYMVDRPQSLHRQPDGLRNDGFFHKDMTSFMPRRIATLPVPSGSSGRTINYVLCQDAWALLYLVNLGCIEFNPWLSRRAHLDRPDYTVIDLDPDDNPFDEVIEVAQAVHETLEAVGVKSYPKTSGSTGLHICVPTNAKFDFEINRAFAETVCRIVNKAFPTLTSIERNPAKRRRRIYLDFMQNRRAQTLAAPYCVRPRPGATVSTPLKWEEVKAGLDPTAYNVATMRRRLAKVGDLWKPMRDGEVNIEAKLKQLSRKFHDKLD